MVCDLEGEVRSHIRFQQQLKLHIETVEDKLETLEKEKEELTLQNVELMTASVPMGHNVHNQRQIQDDLPMDDDFDKSE